MKKLWAVMLLLSVMPVLASDEDPSLDMLLFLGEFTDDQGDWNGPEMDDEIKSRRQTQDTENE